MKRSHIGLMLAAAGASAVLAVWADSPGQAAGKNTDRAENVLMLLSPEQEFVDELRQSYYDILEEAGMNDPDDTEFTLVDMDGDGVRELIVIHGGASYDFYCGVEGEAVWIGGYEQYADLYRPKDGNGVYAVRDKKGKRYVERMTILEDEENGPQLDVGKTSTSNKANTEFKKGILLTTYNANIFITEGEELVLLDEEEYIFPDSDSRFLTYEDLVGLDSRSLRLARNEIYARRGRIFQSEDLGGYFRSKSWYQPTISASDFDENVFNKFEMYNISFIWDYEQSRS